MIIEIVESAVKPAYELLPPKMNSRAATVMLMTIGLQESRLIYREQIGGPARGLWQFEQGGGVKGVLNHSSSKLLAVEVCRARGVDPTPGDVYLRLSKDDVLAAAFARLLLWTDPKALPAVGDEVNSWNLYNRVWRPGKPHPDKWPVNYRAVLKEC